MTAGFRWDDRSLVCSRDEKKSSTVRSRSCSCNLRPPVVCILVKDKPVVSHLTHRQGPCVVCHRFLFFFPEARNKATFDPVQCLLSRQAGSSKVVTFCGEELPPQPRFVCLFYRGGEGGWRWPCSDVTGMNPSLQSGLRKERTKNVTWKGTPVLGWRQEFEKLALVVLAHIRSLADAESDATLSDEVGAKVLLRNPAEDTSRGKKRKQQQLQNRMPPVAKECKGLFLSFLSLVCFFFEMMQLSECWSTVRKAKLMQSSIDHAVGFFFVVVFFLRLIGFLERYIVAAGSAVETWCGVWMNPVLFYFFFFPPRTKNQKDKPNF